MRLSKHPRVGGGPATCVRQPGLETGGVIVGVVVLRQAEPNVVDRKRQRGPSGVSASRVGTPDASVCRIAGPCGDSVELRLYANEVMVENIALYERLGYRETERLMHRGFHRVFMRKEV